MVRKEMTFLKFITEIYQESEDSTFEHNGHQYDLNGLLEETEKYRSKPVLIKDLIWIFKYSPISKNDPRIKSADLSIPIIITELNKKLVVLDGEHRLMKAYLDNKNTIMTKYVEPDILNKFKMN